MNKLVAFRAAETVRLLICFSHLRWDFVHQRPQHLLNRAARSYSVVYFEEPRFEAGASPELRTRKEPSGVTVAVPVLPEGADAAPMLRKLLDGFLRSTPHDERLGWYYTPMALEFSAHVDWDVCVYDCMDELSAFHNPPRGLCENEDRLFDMADLVFTGGYSLYDAKKGRHDAVYAFPSSVDVAHFAGARSGLADPEDQRGIAHPRIGFFGVIDERMDLGLVAAAAAAVPEAQFVMLGPVVKIDPASLPQAPNLHWLGSKSYAELPAYLGNWTAGWMPFALNAATRFISPTKTPEFLAAGLPLVSTAVPDVLRGYAGNGLVTIADHASIASALRATLEPPSRGWRRAVDRHLASQSWDKTWAAMADHLRLAGPAASRVIQAKGEAHV